MPAAAPKPEPAGRLTLALAPRQARRVLATLAVCAAMLAGLAGTSVDLRLADAMFDSGAGDFPWRHAWLAEQFSHVLLKRALVALALACIVLALWDVIRPGPWSALRRLQLRIVAASAVLVPLIISCLKRASSSHCPWDIDRYGGTAPYVALFEAMPAGVAPGHCMPGGHAASALWLVALCVLFLPARPGRAAAAFVVLLAAGIGVGWLQQLRGAHFLSHTLWSAWIACAVLFALLQGVRSGLPGAQSGLLRSDPENGI